MRIFSINFVLLLIFLVISSPAQRADIDYKKSRLQMIENQLVRRGIRDQKVLEAMKKVERHLFVSPEYRDLAYTDGPLPIGANQTISQPYIVALMTELLNLKGEEKILEVGTGSGYQAAILAEIVSRVYSLEIIEELANKASILLQKLGYRNITIRQGDGYQGWKEAAPFEGIIVTAAPDHIPSPLKEQLKIGGRMVIPVGSFYQKLILITKTKDGYQEKEIIPVRFVPMTGEAEKRFKIRKKSR